MLFVQRPLLNNSNAQRCISEGRGQAEGQLSLRIQSTSRTAASLSRSRHEDCQARYRVCR